jgi:hypothetical protein
MCPKDESYAHHKPKNFGICPGIPGTPHPRQSTCNFENTWHDTNGKAVFADSGIGGKNYMSFRHSDSGGLHRVKTKYLPLRKTFDEAQKDLNLYATTYGWKLG